MTLVTGAAGFAGTHLLDLLADTDTEIVGWQRPGSTARPHVKRVRWLPVDMLDRGAVHEAIRSLKPSVVYHCAGAAHVGQAWDATTAALAANVMGTHHLVEALRETAPDARVLIPSSALVYHSSQQALDEDHPLVPANPYGLSKLAQELIGHGNQGFPRIYIARPFNHIGPRQHPSFSTAGFARRIADIEAGRCPPEIHVGNLEPRRDLTDVRDTVRAYLAIIERGVPERPYNVCTGRAVSIGEILNALLARARVPIRAVADPARYRPNDEPVVLGNPHRIREELGWTPAVPLDRTLDDLLEYWRARVP